jgi:nitroreductase
MTYRESIRRRFSVRHYISKPVPAEILDAVEHAANTSIPLDKDINVRLRLIRDGKTVAERMTFQTGRSWLFGSAPHFIIATSDEKPHFMLDTGFRMEQVILFATTQGLGTCWIGGLFSEKTLGDFLKLPETERVIALTPLGYPDTSFYGRTINAIMHLAGPDTRRRKPLAEIVFGPDWGSPLTTRDADLLEILESTRLAPSWTNSQPWMFLVGEKEIIALAQIRSTSMRDGKHYYRLDLGIAMSHFYLAAKELGWRGRWHITGFDPDQVAKQHSVPAGYEVLGIYSEKNNSRFRGGREETYPLQ